MNAMSVDYDVRQTRITLPDNLVAYPQPGCRAFHFTKALEIFAASSLGASKLSEISIIPNGYFGGDPRPAHSNDGGRGMPFCTSYTGQNSNLNSRTYRTKERMVQEPIETRTEIFVRPDRISDRMSGHAENYVIWEYNPTKRTFLACPARTSRTFFMKSGHRGISQTGRQRGSILLRNIAPVSGFERPRTE